MKHSLVVTLAVLLAAVGARCQTPPAPLHDGQQVTLSGRLVMEPQGRLQFVTVNTATAYVPVFKGKRGSREEQGEVLHEIGLAGYPDYALLYAHRGQQVTVTGRVGLDSASPYYWHGTSLRLTSLRLAGGPDLLKSRAPSDEAIAVDTGTYGATVTLPADLAAPWVYGANGQTEPKGRFLSCSSNGGGDVVNCSCARGFHPVGGESLIRERRENAGLLKDMSFAQFAVGEEEKPSAVQLSVTCAR